MVRGRNEDFLVCGIKAIFKKNWGVCIDRHEVDLKLTYSENFYTLHERYIRLKISKEELKNW